jgi:hypothetical protein
VAAGGAGVAADAHDLGGSWPVDPGGGGGADGAALTAAVALALLGPGRAGELGVGPGQRGGDLGEQGGLVGLDEHDVVAAVVLRDEAGGVLLGVQGDDHSLQVQSFQGGAELRDLVGTGEKAPHERERRTSRHERRQSGKIGERARYFPEGQDGWYLRSSGTVPACQTGHPIPEPATTRSGALTRHPARSGAEAKPDLGQGHV